MKKKTVERIMAVSLRISMGGKVEEKHENWEIVEIRETVKRKSKQNYLKSRMKFEQKYQTISVAARRIWTKKRTIIGKASLTFPTAMLHYQPRVKHPTNQMYM